MGVGILAALAIGLAAFSHLRTIRSLRRPFRMGYYKSGVEHFRGPDNEPHGAVVDIMNEAARRAGMQLQWVYSPEGTDAALESGNVDLWPNLGDIPERRGRVYVRHARNFVASLSYTRCSCDPAHRITAWRPPRRVACANTSPFPGIG